MSDAPFLLNQVELGTTPEQTAARFLAAFWGKTFSEPVDETNFIAQASRIVREIRPQIVAIALGEIRQMLLDAEQGDLPVISSLYWEAGESKTNKTGLEELLGDAADLLARIWIRANDGTMDPPNWVTVRQDSWVERFR